ncbi:MAG: DUF1444 family protein, partial [Sedimentisphaerales bacterium]|nr:DUF1444 family protein [Sedimentisphaerales bacterium]
QISHISGLEIPDSFPKARVHILPKIRDHFYYTALQLQSQLSQKPYPLGPYQVWADNLSVELVYDTERAIATITADQLATWGKSYDEVLTVARDNLWQMSNKSFLEASPGVYVSDWQDNHDASRMFLHDLIWQMKVKGDHVVTIPHRDRLMITGSEDEQGLVRMAQETKKEYLENPRRLTALAFRLNDDTWQPYVPAPDHPAYPLFRELHIIYWANVYNEQKQLLDKLHSKEGLNTLVGGYNVASERFTQNIVMSYCIWGDGASWLLPRTEKIGFCCMNESGKPIVLGMADWEQVCHSLGDLIQEDNSFYPVRYRVTQFPSEDHLKKIQLKPVGE